MALENEWFMHTYLASEYLEVNIASHFTGEKREKVRTQTQHIMENYLGKDGRQHVLPFLAAAAGKGLYEPFANRLEEHSKLLAQEAPTSPVPALKDFLLRCYESLVSSPSQLSERPREKRYSARKK